MVMNKTVPVEFWGSFFIFLVNSPVSLCLVRQMLHAWEISKCDIFNHLSVEQTTLGADSSKAKVIFESISGTVSKLGMLKTVTYHHLLPFPNGSFMIYCWSSFVTRIQKITHISRYAEIVRLCLEMKCVIKWTILTEKCDCVRNLYNESRRSQTLCIH